jgi:hypothetical protein
VKRTDLKFVESGVSEQARVVAGQIVRKLGLGKLRLVGEVGIGFFPGLSADFVAKIPDCSLWR